MSDRTTYRQYWKILSDALGVRKYVALSFGFGASAAATVLVSYVAGMFNKTVPAILFHFTFFLLAIVVLALVAVLHHAVIFRRDAEKVDRWDLQHMMGGCYFDNTFMYPAVGFFCKTYNGKFELERLTEGFETISACAPRNSFARLGFQFLNGRNHNRGYKFYFRDGNGDQIAIDNIYEQQTVFLDEQAQFGLKLTHDAAYVIDENASLTIAIEAWTK